MGNFISPPPPALCAGKSLLSAFKEVVAIGCASGLPGLVPGITNFRSFTTELLL